MRKKREKTAYLFLLPSLLGTTIFVFLPFLDVIRRSFFQAVGGVFVGLENYQEVLKNAAFQQALSNTGRFLIVCIPLLLCSSFGMALWIYHLPVGKQLMESVCLLPMAIPVASVVVFWKLLFHENGVLTQMAEWFGYTGKDWINTDAAFWILIFTYLWKNLGYDVVLWIAGLASIPTEHYEAARVDGAGACQSFWNITLPQMTGSFWMIGILSFINAFRVFREAYLIAGDYPHESIYMLQHLFNNWFVKLDIQKMSAAAVMAAAVIGGIFVILQWRMEKEKRL